MLLALFCNQLKPSETEIWQEVRDIDKPVGILGLAFEVSSRSELQGNHDALLALVSSWVKRTLQISAPAATCAS